MANEITCQFQMITSLSPSTSHSEGAMIAGKRRDAAPGRMVMSWPPRLTTKSSWNP